MASTDELVDAAGGVPMDTEAKDATVADEVETTTSSATVGGASDKGEPITHSPLSSGTEVVKGP